MERGQLRPRRGLRGRGPALRVRLSLRLFLRGLLHQEMVQARSGLQRDGGEDGLSLMAFCKEEVKTLGRPLQQMNLSILPLLPEAALVLADPHPGHWREAARSPRPGRLPAALIPSTP
jgi:hypothetical protein